MSAQRITRRKLFEEVADLLINDIKNGRYAGKSELPSESELMKEFGVGRPAIREALAKLSRMGMIEIRAGVKPRIKELSIAPVLREVKGVVQLALSDREGKAHLQQIRTLLESALARQAARTADPSQLAVMKERLDECGAFLHAHPVADDDNIERMADLDVGFHQSIVAAVKNPLLTMIQENLADWLTDQRHKTLRVPGQPLRSFTAHERIFNAIRDRDPDNAERIMFEHLEQTAEIYKE